MIGSYLTDIELLGANREFVSIAGTYKGERITVLSTGIGTDNVDIVVNELDALANIDLTTRRDLPEHRRLRLVRIGTSGSIQPDLPAGSVVSSDWSLGLDGLMRYYARTADAERDRFERAFAEQVDWPAGLPMPYAEKASADLLSRVSSFATAGITVAAHGFYGPQGRQVRAELAVPDLNRRLQGFAYDGLRTQNFEMESSALYGLSNLLGHEAITVCLIIANRMGGSFLGDYNNNLGQLIVNTLESITR
jgi:uridine phosphorylase